MIRIASNNGCCFPIMNHYYTSSALSATDQMLTIYNLTVWSTIPDGYRVTPHPHACWLRVALRELWVITVFIVFAGETEVKSEVQWSSELRREGGKMLHGFWVRNWNGMRCTNDLANRPCEVTSDLISVFQQHKKKKARSLAESQGSRSQGVSNLISIYL